MSVLTNARYNFTLCNLYLTGNNHISYHSDDERFLGASSCCFIRRRVLNKFRFNFAEFILYHLLTSLHEGGMAEWLKAATC